MANEKRLIDANALTDDTYILNSWDAPIVRAWLEDQPTVDAVEVVHGEWVVCGDGEYVPFMCSACGKTTSWHHAQTANYCPNCGADMRGETE